MGHLAVQCGNCGRRWKVYGSDNFNADTAKTCPRCGEQVDAHTWATQVLPAFGMMEDANRELHKDATGYGLTRFKINYKHD